VARLPKRKPVRMRVARARKVIGIPVTEKEVGNVFKRLGLPFKRKAGSFIVTPPSFRFDLEIEEDLIEEVARVHGFERIPALPPRAPATMSAAPEARPATTRKSLPSASWSRSGRRTSRARRTRSGCSTRLPASCR
jgi:phenylalanyl-tRNA synthetase beta chain